MTEYIGLRRSCANELREVADKIELVVKGTGLTRVVGGSVGVASGASIIGGLILAPVTAGASLAFTVGGIAGGVAAAATTVPAAIFKDVKLSKSAEKVKNLLDSLKDKDEVVCKIIEELKEKVEKLRSLYEKKSVISFVEDSTKVAMWIKQIGYNIVYKGYTVYTTVKAINFATAIAQFIQADIRAMNSVAKELAAPGFKFFGKHLILVGSTTAKVVSGAFAVVGIGFGIWDIVTGSMDINESKHAVAYRKAADELDDQTSEYEETLKKIKEVAA